MSYLPSKKGITSRKSGSRKLKTRILIISEGEKTEPTYFKWLKRMLRLSAVDIEVVGAGCDPLSIVEKAIKLYKADYKNNPFDIVYCIVDRDKHIKDKFNKAKDKLLSPKLKKQFRFIISYPCIEYWFILHFNYDNTPYSQPVEGEGSMGSVCKSKLKNIYYPEYDEGDKDKLEKFFEKIQASQLTAIKSAKSIVDNNIISNDTINPLTMLFMPVSHLILLADEKVDDEVQLYEISQQEYEQYITHIFKIFNNSNTL